MQVHVYGGVLPYGLQDLNGTATAQVTRPEQTCLLARFPHSPDHILPS